MSSLKETAASLYENIANAYTALEENGYYLPEQKNAENLAGTIRREFKPPIDPENPTFNMIKLALLYDNPAEYLPIGTEIPDTWNGQSNPLIIGTYKTINNKKAAGLVRKYVEPTSRAFGSNVNYQTSTILTYLNSTYLNACSEELKAVISETAAQWYNGTSIIEVPGKWHLLSGIEVYGTKNTGEGVAWEYWKNKIGTSNPADSPMGNTGRSVADRNGNASYWWLRSQYSSSYVCIVNPDGYINRFRDPNSYSEPSKTSGVLPQCYIIAD